MADLLTRLRREYPDVEVWAAGGLVIREVAGEPEILLVHRPSHGDWSFPKGKLDEGETLGRAAVREVAEETGFTCRRVQRLPVVRYRDGKGRRKLVAYWRMEVESGRFVPNSEVDAAGWFPLEGAGVILTYPHDAALLDALDSTAGARGERSA